MLSREICGNTAIPMVTKRVHQGRIIGGKMKSKESTFETILRWSKWLIIQMKYTLAAVVRIRQYPYFSLIKLSIRTDSVTSPLLQTSPPIDTSV